MEFGLLLLRIVVGALFIGHGAQKLFGAFGGAGPDGTAQFFGSLGYRRPDRAARLAGWAELGGGALLVLGFLTPLGAAIIIGVMINAGVAAHLPNGLWNPEGGYELPLVYATTAAVLAFAGPGLFAIDTALGIMTGPGWGLIALVVGVGAAVATLAWMREPRLDEQVSTTSGSEPAEDEYRDAA